MSSWYSLSLGDGIMSGAPAAAIEAAFLPLFTIAGRPHDMAVFTRPESEGRLHCEVIAYFSPAAHEVARVFNAKPCQKPNAAGLGLLAGDEEAWSALFPDRRE